MDFYRQQHINNYGKLRTLITKLKECDGSGEYDMHGIDIEYLNMSNFDRDKFFKAIKVLDIILNRYKP